MADPREILLAGYKHWRDIGNDLLVGGLIAEVFISAAIAEKRKYKWLAELLAGLVVLVGVWVEVQYGGYADDIERQIRQSLRRDSDWAFREIAETETRLRLADAQIAEANARAAEAGKVAEQARLAQMELQRENLLVRANVKAQARESQARLAELKVEAETARRQIAEADARASEANARIAEANQQAEAERLARVKLEQAMAWRALTDEQSQHIVTALKTFAGERVNLLASPYEPDASPLAIAMSCTLGTCWSVPTDQLRGGGRMMVQLSPRSFWHWPLLVPDASWVPTDSAGWVVSLERESGSPTFGKWLSTVSLAGMHGIEVVTLPNATQRDLAAAKALVCALWAEHFDIAGPRSMPLELNGSWFSNLDSKARIIVFVESRVPPDLKRDSSRGPSCGQADASPVKAE